MEKEKEKTAKQLISNENKRLIWKLLTDAGAFQNIPEDMVKEDFDKKIKSMADQIKQTDKLVNLNKSIISEMMVSIANHKARTASIINDVTVNTNTYNASDILQQRQKAFQNEFASKKNEFDKMNAVVIPDKIDFSDTLDAPIGSEMDKMVAAQIALREKQLYSVLETQDKSAASKWLNNEAAASDKKLKIGEPIDLVTGNSLGPTKLPSPKKVNFKDDGPLPTIESDNFMALLKKKDAGASVSRDTSRDTSVSRDTSRETSVSRDTNSLLREILDKQNQILALLTKQN